MYKTARIPYEDLADYLTVAEKTGDQIVKIETVVAPKLWEGELENHYVMVVTKSVDLQERIADEVLHRWERTCLPFSSRASQTPNQKEVHVS